MSTPIPEDVFVTEIAEALIHQGCLITDCGRQKLQAILGTEEMTQQLQAILADQAQRDEGFYGRAAARLTIERDQLKDRIAKLEAELQEITYAAEDRLTRAARSVADSLEQRRRLERAVASATALLKERTT